MVDVMTLAWERMMSSIDLHGYDSRCADDHGETTASARMESWLESKKGRSCSNPDGIDRAALDLGAHMGVEAGVAGGKNLQGGQHGVGGFQHRHHRHVARRAQ